MESPYLILLIKYLEKEGDKIVLEISSGDYLFTSNE